MTRLISIYHRLPYPFRSLAASLHGFRLQKTRYSEETDRLVAEAYRREKWTFQQWQSWQAECLAYTLEHAARNVPYYRQQWSLRRNKGDRSSVELLQNWPVLKKDAVRDRPHAFVADGVNPRDQIIEHTSGTTGKPLTLWWSKSAALQWYALFEARWRGWAGVSRHDRWGVLGGQLVSPFSQKQPPFWVWNAGMNQLYFSSYHLRPENMAAYVDAMHVHRLVYLYGYASSLYSLARNILELKLRIPRLRAVISNAEPLYLHQRDVISEAFGCPVFDTYGQSELVCGASECLSGSLHLWQDAGILEIIDDRQDIPISNGKVGRMIGTGLLNLTMPLIRYEIGDRASVAGANNVCACGRQMSRISSLEGRMDDVVVTPDGRRIGRLDPIFKAELPIREAQIIQEKLSELHVRYVPAAGFGPESAGKLIALIQSRVGDMRIVLEEVESIPRTANGKFRAVISKVAGPENKC
jgi:phenylacetate-CoA ligase